MEPKIQASIEALRQREGTQKDYENIAEYLNTHRDTVTDITGINIQNLIDTSAARQNIIRQTAGMQELLDSLSSTISQNRITDARQVLPIYERSQNLQIGMEWSVNFSEEDLVRFANDAPLPNVAVFTRKLPEGLNISKVQREAGVRLCLAGVSAEGCTMDVRDYTALPASWKPSTSPILYKEDKVVQASVKVDPDVAMIAAAAFSSLNPTETEARQLQDIFTKQVVLEQKQGINAIIDIMSEIKEKGRNHIEEMHTKATDELERYKGGGKAKPKEVEIPV